MVQSKLILLAWTSWSLATLAQAQNHYSSNNADEFSDHLSNLYAREALAEILFESSISDLIDTLYTRSSLDSYSDLNDLSTLYARGPDPPSSTPRYKCITKPGSSTAGCGKIHLGHKNTCYARLPSGKRCANREFVEVDATGSPSPATSPRYLSHGKMPAAQMTEQVKAHVNANAAFRKSNLQRMARGRELRLPGFDSGSDSDSS